uniref:Protein phosphatase 2C, putative n=1 Tax=Entamoeba invadens TaxID=33085 RepID=S0B5Z7_ENTIV|nr:protein phosphatase 2C, putative [Entamoeba invadens]
MSDENSPNQNFEEYDDSTDSSEEEFIRQQQEKQRLHLPRKSSTILIEKTKPAVLVEDKDIDVTEFDSDDEDLNASHISVYETTEKYNVAISQTRGGRNYNEDRTCAKSIDPSNALFGVFDGHNGHEAATFCRDNIKQIYQDQSFDLTKTFETLHNEVAKTTGAGCTATVVAIKGDEAFFANVGDSPAFVIKSDNSIEKMSYSHKTNDPSEEKMIVENGGVILNLFNTKRVNGQIMVTRSIGDKALHPPLSSTPSLYSIPLNEIKSIVLMSDGVTDALTDLEIRDVLVAESSVVTKAQTIRNIAYKGGSKDNICVVVIEL